MAGQHSTEAQKLKQARVVVESVAKTLETLDPLALLQVEQEASKHEALLRADLARAEERLNAASNVHQVATALVLLRLGADLVAVSETGSLPEPDLPADPIGQQAATVEILAQAEELLSADEIQRRLGLRLGRTPSIASVQNLLSRMVRHDPPLVARPKRGLYGPIAVPSEGAGKNFQTRTNVRPRTGRSPTSSPQK